MTSKENWDTIWREGKYSDVVRIEVIDRNGRSYITYNAKDLQLSLQDKGKTLKLLVDNTEGLDTWYSFKMQLDEENSIDKKEYPFFDLEQNIMECWGIKEDLELLYSKTDDIKTNELQNALLGMIQLIDWRFQRLFDNFEKAMKSRGDGND